MTDPVFIEGQMITPVYTNGYALTMGKEYQVVMYESQCADVNYTCSGTKNEAIKALRYAIERLEK